MQIIKKEKIVSRRLFEIYTENYNPKNPTWIRSVICLAYVYMYNLSYNGIISHIQMNIGKAKPTMRKKLCFVKKVLN